MSFLFKRRMPVYKIQKPLASFTPMCFRFGPGPGNFVGPLGSGPRPGYMHLTFLDPKQKNRIGNTISFIYRSAKIKQGTTDQTTSIGPHQTVRDNTAHLSNSRIILGSEWNLVCTRSQIAERYDSPCFKEI